MTHKWIQFFSMRPRTFDMCVNAFFSSSLLYARYVSINGAELNRKRRSQDNRRRTDFTQIVNFAQFSHKITNSMVSMQFQM